MASVARAERCENGLTNMKTIFEAQPCGLTFYTGDKFPGWRESIFTGALSNRALFRIEVDGERYVGEERLLVDRLPFIRDVRQGPDGFLYLVTEADDGGLYRLEPA